MKKIVLLLRLCLICLSLWSYAQCPEPYTHCFEVTKPGDSPTGNPYVDYGPDYEQDERYIGTLRWAVQSSEGISKITFANHLTNITLNQYVNIKSNTEIDGILPGGGKIAITTTSSYNHRVFDVRIQHCKIHNIRFSMAGDNYADFINIQPGLGINPGHIDIYDNEFYCYGELTGSRQVYAVVVASNSSDIKIYNNTIGDENSNFYSGVHISAIHSSQPPLEAPQNIDVYNNTIISTDIGIDLRGYGYFPVDFSQATWNVAVFGNNAIKSARANPTNPFYAVHSDFKNAIQTGDVLISENGISGKGESGAVIQLFLSSGNAVIQDTKEILGETIVDPLGNWHFDLPLGSLGVCFTLTSTKAPSITSHVQTFCLPDPCTASLIPQPSSHVQVDPITGVIANPEGANLAYTIQSLPSDQAAYTSVLQLVQATVNPESGVALPDWTQAQVVENSFNVSINQSYTTPLSSFTVQQTNTSQHYFVRAGLKNVATGALEYWSSPQKLILGEKEMPMPDVNLLSNGGGVFNTDINWNYEITYLDDNKTDRVIAYTDGIGMLRQVQARIESSEGQNGILCSESVPSEEGGSQVQTMLAPTGNSMFMYDKDFFDVEEDNVKKDFATRHFDRDVVLGTNKLKYAATEAALTTVPGSVGYYFSSNNAEEKFIDDAKGFVYGHSVSEKDPRGRVMEAGGLGEAFNFSVNGKRTKVSHAKAEKTELHRLFGKTFANSTKEINKTIMIDPNGVGDVTYSDNDNNVIATAIVDCMASDALSRLNEDGKASYKIVSNFVENDHVDMAKFEKISTSTIQTGCKDVPVYIKHKIDLTKLPLGDGSCKDCKYELTLTITDPEGNVFFEKKAVPAMTATSCNTTEPYMLLGNASEGYNLVLPDPGTYTITRIIKPYVDPVTGRNVMEQAINDLEKDIATNQTTYYNSFLNDYWGEEKYYVMRKLIREDKVDQTCVTYTQGLKGDFQHYDRATEQQYAPTDEQLANAIQPTTKVMWPVLKSSGHTFVPADNIDGYYYGPGNYTAGSDYKGTFYVKWSGTIDVPETETYTFRTFADNGHRMIVDGKTMTEEWNINAPGGAFTSEPIHLTAGKHDILAYVYNYGGPYRFAMEWKKGGDTDFEMIPVTAFAPPGGSYKVCTPVCSGTACDKRKITPAAVKLIEAINRVNNVRNTNRKADLIYSSPNQIPGGGGWGSHEDPDDPGTPLAIADQREGSVILNNTVYKEQCVNGTERCIDKTFQIYTILGVDQEYSFGTSRNYGMVLDNGSTSLYPELQSACTTSVGTCTWKPQPIAPADNTTFWLVYTASASAAANKFTYVQYHPMFNASSAIDNQGIPIRFFTYDNANKVAYIPKSSILNIGIPYIDSEFYIPTVASSSLGTYVDNASALGVAVDIIVKEGAIVKTIKAYIEAGSDPLSTTSIPGSGALDVFKWKTNASDPSAIDWYLDEVRVKEVDGKKLIYDLDGTTDQWQAGNIISIPKSERYRATGFHPELLIVSLDEQKSTGITTNAGTYINIRRDFIETYKKQYFKQLSEAQMSMWWTELNDRIEADEIDELIPTLQENYKLSSQYSPFYLLRTKINKGGCQYQCQVIKQDDCGSGCQQRMQSYKAKLNQLMQEINSFTYNYSVNGQNKTLAQLIAGGLPIADNVFQTIGEQEESVSYRAAYPNGYSGTDLYLQYYSTWKFTQDFDFQQCVLLCKGDPTEVKAEICRSASTQFKGCVQDNRELILDGYHYLLEEKWVENTPFPYAQAKEINDEERQRLGDALADYLTKSFATVSKTRSAWLAKGNVPCQNCGYAASLGCDQSGSYLDQNPEAFPDLLVPVWEKANLDCHAERTAALQEANDDGECANIIKNCTDTKNILLAGTDDDKLAAANLNCSSSNCELLIVTSRRTRMREVVRSVMAGRSTAYTSEDVEAQMRIIELEHREALGLNGYKRMPKIDFERFLIELEDELECQLECKEEERTKFNQWLKTLVRERKEKIVTNFYSACFGGLNETGTVQWNSSEHHHTLFYYSSTGQLIKTVPPEGVDYIDVNSTNAQELDREPEHRLASTATWNNVGKQKTNTTPDNGTSEFLYDKLGQIRFVQTQEQRERSTASLLVFTYTKYDPESAEVVESGEARVPMSNGATNILASPMLSTQVDVANYPNDPGQTFEESYVMYGTAQTILQGYTPTFTEGKISQICNDQGCTHLSYDIHGRINFVLQDYRNVLNIGTAATLGEQGIKTIKYDYHPITSQINKVIYQEGVPGEYFVHHYTYDRDNRLVDVKISEDGVNKVDAAKYAFYQHGALKAMTLGDNIQKQDYVYNAHGWLKAINHAFNELDPGQDGNGASMVAKDVFGEVLHYYTGDYSRTGNGLDASAAVTPTQGSTLKNWSKDLYDGTVTSAITNTAFDQVQINKSNILMQGYQYDVLYRLTGSRSDTMNLTSVPNSPTYSEADFIASGKWKSNVANYFSEEISFDANSNITRMKRTNAGGKFIDKSKYVYKMAPSRAGVPSSKKRIINNRLLHVLEQSTDNVKEQGIRSQGTDTITNVNYKYDGSGRLIQDLSKQIAKITWNSQNKVTSVIRTGASTKPNLYFTYDAAGNRLTKKVDYPTALDANDHTQIYSNDAQGHVVAIYEERRSEGSSTDVSYQLEDFVVYGSDRLGTYNVNRKLHETSPLPSNNPYSKQWIMASNNGSSQSLVFNPDGTTTLQPLTGSSTTVNYSRISSNVANIGSQESKTESYRFFVQYYPACTDALSSTSPTLLPIQTEVYNGSTQSAVGDVTYREYADNKPINHTWNTTGSLPTSVDNDGKFYMKWNGYINITATGTYTFKVLADYAAKLTVNGTSNQTSTWGNAAYVGTLPVEQSFTYTFASTGRMPISLEYYDDKTIAYSTAEGQPLTTNTSSRIQLLWALPATPATFVQVPAASLTADYTIKQATTYVTQQQTGWTAKYFNNAYWSNANSPTLATFYGANELNSDHIWNNVAPDPTGGAVPFKHTFSAEYVFNVVLGANEVYTMRARTESGGKAPQIKLATAFVAMTKDNAASVPGEYDEWTFTSPTIKGAGTFVTTLRYAYNHPELYNSTTYARFAWSRDFATFVTSNRTFQQGVACGNYPDPSLTQLGAKAYFISRTASNNNEPIAADYATNPSYQSLLVHQIRHSLTLDNKPHYMMPSLGDRYAAVYQGNYLAYSTGIQTLALNNLQGAARVLVNGKVILDNWDNYATTPVALSKEIFLTRGVFEIRVEYYNTGTPASFSLSFTNPLGAINVGPFLNDPTAGIALMGNTKVPDQIKAEMDGRSIMLYTSTMFDYMGGTANAPTDIGVLFTHNKGKVYYHKFDNTLNGQRVVTVNQEVPGITYDPLINEVSFAAINEEAKGRNQVYVGVNKGNMIELYSIKLSDDGLNILSVEKQNEFRDMKNVSGTPTDVSTIPGTRAVLSLGNIQVHPNGRQVGVAITHGSITETDDAIYEYVYTYPWDNLKTLQTKLLLNKSPRPTIASTDYLYKERQAVDRSRAWDYTHSGTNIYAVVKRNTTPAVSILSYTLSTPAAAPVAIAASQMATFTGSNYATFARGANNRMYLAHAGITTGYVLNVYKIESTGSLTSLNGLDVLYAGLPLQPYRSNYKIKDHYSTPVSTIAKAALRFELKDYLGSVRAVVTGEKNTDGMANIVSLADYYPHGLIMRGFTSQKHRYGFHGMENSNEMEDAYTTDFRNYDAAIGRWLSPDPYMGSFSDMSPYNFCDGDPINNIDEDGDLAWAPLVNGLRDALGSMLIDIGLDMFEQYATTGKMSLSKVEWGTVGYNAGKAFLKGIADYFNPWADNFVIKMIKKASSNKYGKVVLDIVDGVIEDVLNEVTDEKKRQQYRRKVNGEWEWDMDKIKHKAGQIMAANLAKYAVKKAGEETIGRLGKSADDKVKQVKNNTELQVDRARGELRTARNNFKKNKIEIKQRALKKAIKANSNANKLNTAVEVLNGTRDYMVDKLADKAGNAVEDEMPYVPEKAKEVKIETIKEVEPQRQQTLPTDIIRPSAPPKTSIPKRQLNQGKSWQWKNKDAVAPKSKSN